VETTQVWDKALVQMIAENDNQQVDASSKLSAATKIIYGTGQSVDAIIATILIAFLFFFLTVVCKLSGPLAGALLMITLLIDAVVDPLIGALSDVSRSRWGRRHVFMLGSIVPLALSLGLMFSLPASLGEWQTFGALLALLATMRIAYSAFLLPYSALGAELTDDYAERSSVVAYRQTVASAMSFVPIVFGYWIFLAGPKGLLDRAGYVPFAWACAAVVLVFGLFCAIATLPLRHRLHTATPIEPGTRVSASLLHSITAVARDRSFLLLFFVVLIFNVAQGITLNLNIHVSKYFWHLSDQSLRVLGLVQPAGFVLGIPFSVLVTRYFEKRAIVVGGFVLFCTAQALLPLLKLIGVLPESENVAITLLSISNALMAAGYTVLFISFTSMIADAADQHELHHGARREALFFAGVAFATKAAAAVGGMAAGVVLTLVGFPQDVAHHPVTSTTANLLGLAAGPCAAIVTTLCVFLTSRYRLDRAAHQGILEQLKLRRSA
jgi:GPH family glycoside/pentoside/hexuronide:cation symporter